MKTLTLITAIAAIASGLALAEAAQARERQTTLTGTKGRTATRHVQRAGGDVNATTTGPNGNSMARSVDRNADGTTNASITGPNGRTATRQVTRSGEGSSATVTGPNGQSLTRSTTVTP